MTQELKLHSPAGSDPAVYTWPLPSTVSPNGLVRYCHRIHCPHRHHCDTIRDKSECAFDFCRISTNIRSYLDNVAHFVCHCSLQGRDGAHEIIDTIRSVLFCRLKMFEAHAVSVCDNVQVGVMFIVPHSDQNPPLSLSVGLALRAS